MDLMKGQVELVSAAENLPDQVYSEVTTVAIAS